MTLWPDEPVWVLDLETTGTDTATALPVQIACGILADHCGLENQVFTTLVDPGCEIPEAASAVHGISTERAQAEGVPVIEALSATLAALYTCAVSGRPLVVMNARYDLTILERLAHEHGTSLPKLVVLDPFVIDRAKDRYRRGRRTLSALCEHYGVAFDGAAHDARADAVAAGKLMLALADVYPQLRRKRPADLHKAQVTWFAEWKDGFNAYLARKSDSPDFVTGTWPVAA